MGRLLDSCESNSRDIAWFTIYDDKVENEVRGKKRTVVSVVRLHCLLPVESVPVSPLTINTGP